MWCRADETVQKQNQILNMMTTNNNLDNANSTVINSGVNVPESTTDENFSKCPCSLNCSYPFHSIADCPESLFWPPSSSSDSDCDFFSSHDDLSRVTLTTYSGMKFNRRRLKNGNFQDCLRLRRKRTASEEERRVLSEFGPVSTKPKVIFDDLHVWPKNRLQAGTPVTPPRRVDTPRPNSNYICPQSGPRPEMGLMDMLGTFKVGLDATTSELLQGVSDTLKHSTEKITSLLPDEKTRESLQKLIDSLIEKAKAVGDSEAVQSLISTATHIKENFSEYAFRGLRVTSNVFLFVNTFAAVWYALRSKSTLSIVYAVVSCVAQLLLSSSVDDGRSILGDLITYFVAHFAEVDFDHFEGYPPGWQTRYTTGRDSAHDDSADGGFTRTANGMALNTFPAPNVQPHCDVYGSPPPDAPHIRPEVGGEDVDDWVDGFTTIFASYVSCTSGKNVPVELFKNFGQASRVSSTLTSTVRLVISLFEKAINWIRVQCFKAPSMRFMDSRSEFVNEYLDGVDELIEISRSGMLFDNTDNIARLNAMIKVGSQMIKTIPRDKYSSGSVTLILDCVRKLEKIVVKMSSCNLAFKGTRQEPVGVLIRGGPGSGKTTVMEHLYRAFLASTLPDDLYEAFKLNPAEFVYNRQAETKYWDKYTLRKYVCLFDDFGQITDVAGVADGEVMDIIRAINTFEDVLHSAHLDDKGVMTFMSTLVLATTNMEILKAESIRNIDALKRRFVIDVICCPKVEFCTEETKHGSVWDRKFNPALLPIVEYSDFATFRNPGIKRTTALIPEIQEFHILRNEKMGYERPLGFVQLVERIMCEHDKRRAWFLTQKDQFERTMLHFRDLYTDIVESSIPATTDASPQAGIMPMVGGWDNEPVSPESIDPDLIMETLMKDNPSPEVKSRGSSNSLSGLDPYSLGEDDDLMVPHDMDNYDEFSVIMDFEPNVQKAALKVFAYSQGLSYNGADTFDSQIGLICRTIYERDMSREFVPVVLYAMLCRDLKVSFFRVFDNPELLERLLNQVMVRGVRREVVLPCLVEWSNGVAKSRFSVMLTSFLETFEDNSLVILWRAAGPKLKTLMVVAGIVMSAVGYKIISAIYEWFTGKPMPESFGFNSKMSSQRKDVQRLTPGQLKAKMGVQPATGQAGGPDPAGSSLIDRLIRTNQYELLVQNVSGVEEYNSWGFLTFVKPHVAVIPYHYLLKWEYYVSRDPANAEAIVKLSPGKESSGSAYAFPVKFFLERFESERLLKLDLALVNFGNHVQPHRDILIHLMKLDDWNVRLSGIPFSMEFPRKGGSKHVGLASAVEYEITVNSEETGKYIIPKYFTYQGFTDSGDCGALFCSLNSHSPVRKIFGVHVAGHLKGGPSYAVPLFQEDVVHDLTLFTDLVREVITEDIVDLIEPECNAKLSRGQFGIVGKLKRAPNVVQHTRYRKSRMHGVYHDVVCTPAKMFHGCLDEELLRACPDPIYMEWAPIVEVRKELYAHLVHVSTYTFGKRLLTPVEAVFGVDGIRELKGIELKTSSGYPANVSGNLDPKVLLRRLDREASDFQIRFDIIVSSAMAALDKIKAGIRPIFLYTTFPKDETRPFGKRTRLIDGAPFDLNLLYNMYFGSFVAEFMANRITNGSAVGVNVYSTEWDTLARHLSTFDFKMGVVGAGDYSGYNFSLRADILWQVLNLINTWYNDEIVNQRVRIILWYEIIASRHIIDGVVYVWFSGMPSGNPLTAIINTLYNMFAFRLAFRDIMKVCFLYHRFDEKVRFIGYGDDNSFNVHPDIRYHFNELTLVPALLKYGLVYTTEFKLAATLPFRNLDQIEFLKRTFRYIETENRWVAPLRLEVILNTPCWTKRGPYLEEIPSDNIVFALRELSLHPREVFDEWAPKLILAFENNYPNSQTSMPLHTSYDALQQMVLKLDMFL